MINDLTFSDQDDFEKYLAHQCIILGYDVVKEIK